MARMGTPTRYFDIITDVEMEFDALDRHQGCWFYGFPSSRVDIARIGSSTRYFCFDNRRANRTQCS